MKILHTSDLHLGMSYDGHARLPDQMRVLQEVLGLCEQHDVDLLLITGDIFADRVESSLPIVARQFVEQLRGPLVQGRAVFLLRGNHDHFGFFQLLRVLVNELAGQDRWPLVIADVPGIYRIPGHEMQVVALPYMSPSWIEQNPPRTDMTQEERLSGLSGTLAAYVQWLGQTSSPNLPSIFAGHLMIQGTHIDPEMAVERGYIQELILDPKYLPHFTSYNALGHIHLAQTVKHTAKPTWYSGGSDRLDLGEKDYQPQVLLVTTPDHPGGVSAVQPIRLTSCTQFVRDTLAGMEAVRDFCYRTSPLDPLGRLTLTAIPIDDRRKAEELIRQVAPRLRIEWGQEATPSVVEDHALETLEFHDIPKTVGTYLSRMFCEQPDRLARLSEAFVTLWNAPVGEVNR